MAAQIKFPIHLPGFMTRSSLIWKYPCLLVQQGISAFLLLTVTISCFAKSGQHPGIKAPAKHPSQEDITLVDRWIKESETSWQSAQYKVARIAGERALQHAKSVNYPEGIALAQATIGIISFHQRNYKVAAEALSVSRKICRDSHFDDVEAIIDCYTGAILAIEGKLDSGLIFAHRGLTFFTLQGDPKGHATALFLIGMIYKSQGLFDQALDYFSQALKKAEAIGYTWCIAASQSAIGTVHGNQGSYNEALINFMSCIPYWEQLVNKPGLADTYHHIGNVHFYRSNFAEALTRYLQALKYREEIGDQAKIAESYHDIGHIYFKQAQYAEALNNYRNALEIFKASGIRQRMGLAYNSIGNAYTNLGNIPLALENYEASIALQEEIGDKPGLIYSYNNIEQLNLMQHDYSSARKNLHAAQELGLLVGDQEGLALSYQQLGALYLDMGHLKESKEYLSKSLSLSKRTGSKNMIMSGYRLMASADSMMGNYQAALTQYQLFKAYSDSLTGEEKERIIADLKIGYESEKKDHEIQRLENERELQMARLKKQTLLKNYLVGGLILFALLAFFAYNYFTTRQKLKLQMLRNRIASDLHDDVGSTLSSIAIFSEIAQQQSREVVPMLQTIGESSRKMLEAMTDIVWTINPENDQFENIILRMRSYAYELLGAKDIGFDFTADDHLADIKLPMDVRKNLFLIFKEATNNIMKYSDADKALFSIRTQHEHLCMVISDNGKGFDLLKPTEGNGLKNMKKRALEVGGKLLIESLPGGGTTIQLTLAL
jgi:two-component system sensor histidine kinase UhpB